MGLIGLGAIGQGVTRLLQPGDAIDIVGALVANPNKPRPGGHGPRLCRRVEDVIALEPEVVVEAAGHAALRCYGPLILRSGIDLLMVSVGALADPDSEAAIRAAASDGKSQATVISGAIGALDSLAAASVRGLTSVTHTTRKPPRNLLPADEAASLRGPRVLFDGSAREGVLRFPESVNVAAAVSLAGVGLDRTVLRVIADPGVDRNCHEVVAEGHFGRFTFQIDNIPSEENPRTGRLVAMSVVHALRRRKAGLAIG